MNSTKMITKTLFGIFRLLAVAYLITVAYAVLCLVTGWCTTLYGDNKFVHINYPFTQIPFLNLDNNLNYQLFNFIIPLLLYGLFFWLTANVFRIFYQDKLFTQKNIAHLKLFYYLNIPVPAVVTVICSLFVDVEPIMWILVLVHFVLGIFTWLLATIFRKGVKLQNEQDLFI